MVVHFLLHFWRTSCILLMGRAGRNSQKLTGVSSNRLLAGFQNSGPGEIALGVNVISSEAAMVRVELKWRPLGTKVKGQKKEKESAYLDIYHTRYDADPGKREKVSLGLYRYTGDKIQDQLDKDRADEMCIQKRKVLNYGESDNAERRKESFIEYYNKLANRKTGNTKLSWIAAGKHLAACFPDGLTFAQVNYDALDEFRDYVEKHLTHKSSAALYLTHIKSAIWAAVDDEILAKGPSRKVKIAVPQRKAVSLTEEEVNKLWETPCRNEEVKRAFLWSVYSGLRWSDVQRLTWKQIDFVGADKAYIEYVQTKTGRFRRDPLSPEAQTILREQKKVSQGDLVFTLPHRANVNLALKDWAKAAGIGIAKQLSFHKGRHTFGNSLKLEGAHINTIRDLMGHASIRTTQIYMTDSSEEEKEEALKKLPRLSRKVSPA
jgi:integrase